MDMTNTGKFIAELRKEQGLTQEQLGEKIGVTNKTISRWETGIYLPPADALLTMSEMFSVSINEILSGRRLPDEEYKEAAEENLTQTIKASSFELKDKIEFFKKKWLKEHIAMSFATWISPEFQLYIMKDYRRLKTDENSRLSLNWNLNREIFKLNYRIYTDAIKENLIPPELTSAQIAYTYANEADMLSVVLFGKTAKQWKDENPLEKGNMRDVATLNQLLVLVNLESYNAVLINQGKNWNV